MFSNKKNIQADVEMTSSGKPETTIISSGTNIDGTLKAAGTLRVDGVFNGTMNVEGSVIIGEGGYVKGNIRTDKIVIAGKVEGNIYSNGTLELTSNGRLYGDIEVKNIIIADGAIFQGKCIMAQYSEPSDDSHTEDYSSDAEYPDETEETSTTA